jgi:uncharacterized protein
MTPAITALYAMPLALMMLGLSTYVTMLRAKTGISIMDGGNTALAERIRRHGNFIENVPMALLLMALAELLGAGSSWLHAAGAFLIVGRILHVMGIHHDKPAAVARIAGGTMTNISVLIAVGNLFFRTMMQ